MHRVFLVRRHSIRNRLHVVVVLILRPKSGPDEASSTIVGEQEVEVLALVPENICYERIPGQGRSEICSAEDTSSQGGGVANLVAFLRLGQIRSSEISLLNAG